MFFVSLFMELLIQTYRRITIPVQCISINEDKHYGQQLCQLYIQHTVHTLTKKLDQFNVKNHTFSLIIMCVF